MQQKIIWKIIGWYGTLAIISAYFLNSFGILSITNFWYPFLNITGATGIVLVSYTEKAYEAMTLNIIWTIIGIITLIRMLF